MTEYAQFAHINHAGLKPANDKRGRDKKWTAKQILAEAARVPGNYAHVVKPQKPIWLVGSKSAVQIRQVAWRAQAREASGKARLRATSPSLACAVVSWPRGRELEWTAYRDDVISFQAWKCGPERLVGVVEHLDESHQHIHIYLVPLDGEPFGIVHPGIAARTAHRGVDGNHTRTAYIDAMVEWQDELWRATGQPHGLLRIGNARARLSRIEFTESMKFTKAAADAKVMEEQASTRRRKLEADERLLQIRAKDLIDAMQHLELREARFTEESAGTVTQRLAAA